MKGRYNGCHMSIYGSVLPGALRLARLPIELSRPARQRLKWFDFYRTHGQNARLTCRYFGISPQTFYRWQRRYEPRDLTSLEGRSSRPRRLRRATATTAAAFLDALQARLPFSLRALQVDGGGEFRAELEALCQPRGLPLFVLPPKSLKLNGHVERAHRTHTEEFYECYDGDVVLAALRPALRQWEAVYNTVRPHQALGYLTPQQYLVHYHGSKEEEVSLR